MIRTSILILSFCLAIHAQAAGNSATDSAGNAMRTSESVLSGSGLVDQAPNTMPVLGLVTPFKYAPGKGEGLAAMGVENTNKLIFTDDRRKNLELYLKGFLSRMDNYRLAETDGAKLGEALKEYSLAMTGAGNANVQAGSWKSVDWFVIGQMATDKLGAFTLEADLVSTSGRDTIRAIAGPRGKQFNENSVMLARDLAFNLETMLAEPDPGKRALLFQMQSAEARSRSFDPGFRNLLRFIGYAYLGAGLLGLDHTIRSNFMDGKPVAGVFNGLLTTVWFGLGGVSLWAAHDYDKNWNGYVNEYNLAAKEYNERYGGAIQMMEP